MPCRFIHCADLHLDSPPLGLSEQAAIAHRQASRQALQLIVERCLDHQVDFLLIAGDLYDRELSDFSVIEAFNQGMRALDQAGIPVFVLRGNHDAANKAIPQLLAPPNVHVFPAGKPSSVILDKAVIHGWSYANEAEPDFDYRAYPAAHPGAINIGMLHTGLESSGPYAPVRPQHLAQLGYDYWALGHIHTHSFIEEAGARLAYPGIPQGRAIDETGIKGALEVHIDAQGVKATFFPTASLIWQKLRLPAQGMSTDEAVLAAVADAAMKALDDLEAPATHLAVRMELEDLPINMQQRRFSLQDQIADTFAGKCQGRVVLEGVKFVTNTQPVALAKHADVLQALLADLESDVLSETYDSMAQRLDAVLGNLDKDIDLAALLDRAAQRSVDDIMAQAFQET